MSGLFITFEGADGCGKTTQVELFHQYLQDQQIPNVLTEEPGGTSLGREIKALLLDQKYGKLAPTTELLLFAAARAQHVAHLIRPALAEGKCVVSSRFADATTVYQGVARGLDLDLILELGEVATEGLKPDITFLLDLDPKIGLKRAQETEKSTARKGEMDKIEAEGIAFQKKVRQGYLDLAHDEPSRFHIISADQTVEAIHLEIVTYFESVFKKDLI